MLSIFYCNSEKHTSTFNHPENLMRVDIAVKFLKETLNKNYFPINEIRNREECIKLMIEIHGEEILDTFSIKYATKIICQKCKNIHNGIICTKCYHEFYTWYKNEDTFVSNTSFNDVIKCISTILNSINSIKFGYKYSYLLIRPPGHHCYNKGKGFCLVNNAIIASKYAQSIGYKNIYILDWDYHHGDGTAQLLNDNTFLCSIHAYGNLIYPGTGGIEENTFNCLNIPLDVNIHSNRSRTQYNDNYYLNLIDSIVIPSIINFETDLLIISNGLDAHMDDTMEGLGLTNTFFIEATKKLKQVNIPIVYLLEGGYNPEVIKSVSIDIINELKR